MSGSVSLVALSPGYCFRNARLPAEPIFSPILQLVVYVYEVSCRYNTSRMDEIFLINPKFTKYSIYGIQAVYA